MTTRLHPGLIAFAVVVYIFLMGPLIIVFLISYSVAYLFMSMYSTTSTCILHALYADVDICKQLNYD